MNVQGTDVKENTIKLKDYYAALRAIHAELAAIAERTKTMAQASCAHPGNPSWVVDHGPTGRLAGSAGPSRQSAPGTLRKILKRDVLQNFGYTFAIDDTPDFVDGELRIFDFFLPTMK